MKLRTPELLLLFYIFLPVTMVRTGLGSYDAVGTEV